MKRKGRAPAAGMAVAAAVLGVLLAGCGSSSGGSQRTLVVRYIQQANAIEAQFAKPLKAVTQAGSDFASEQRAGTTPVGSLLDVAHENALRTARRQIDALTHRLMLLAPPPPARRLHAMLIQLAHRQSALTGETARMVVFLPRFAASLRPLAAATGRLQAALSSTQALGYGQSGVSAALSVKATALEHYRSDVSAVVTQLKRLTPPNVSRPQYETQLHTLQGLSDDAHALATALTQGSGDVATLLQKFDRAAAGTQAPAAQHAQASAIRGYDALVGSLGTLTHRIAEERARLASTVK